jgi:hypothetical protein
MTPKSLFLRVPFNHNQHNFQVQPEEFINLIDKTSSEKLGPPRWNRRIEFVFICAIFFIFHFIEFLKD